MIRDIEETYQAFYVTLPDGCEEKIDFLGLDLYEGELVWKAYIWMDAQKLQKDSAWAAELSSSGLLQQLVDREIVYRLETVHDTRDTWHGRYDIAIDCRCDENMQWFWEMLEAKVPFIKEHEPLLRTLAGMPVTDCSGYSQAALYHLGVKEDAGVICGMKFYYLTRHHRDIPKSNVRYAEYRDEFYLDAIADTQDPYFKRLLPIAKDILSHCGGHIWYAGVDLSENGKRRSKIYLKKVQNLPDWLENAFEGRWRDRAKELAGWIQAHPELSLTGLAIGTDSTETFTLNLYFSP